MEKPALLAQLEKTLGIPLHPAPAHGHDPVRNVMACRKDPQYKGQWRPQYALHPDGALAGLNLAGLGLTDKKWEEIVAVLPLARLEALNLRDNALTELSGFERIKSAAPSALP